MKICSIKDCDRPARGRGLCHKHWSSARKAGTFTNIRKKNPDRGCLIKDCTLPHDCHGYCTKHVRLYKMEKDPVGYKTKIQDWNKTPKARYRQLIAAAIKRNLTLSISPEEHAAILSSPCHYCGGELNKMGSGLDRVDSSKGYLIDNVVACCWLCNRFKSSMSPIDFINHSIRIAEHNGRV